MSWTHIVPVISTHHMPADDETADNLRTLADAVAEYEQGFFVRIGGRDDGTVANLPAWLHPVCAWAWAMYGPDTSWVRLDADGDTIPALPLFDWS